MGGGMFSDGANCFFELNLLSIDRNIFFLEQFDYFVSAHGTIQLAIVMHPFFNYKMHIFDPLGQHGNLTV